MPEQIIRIASGDHSLEAAYEPGHGPDEVVLCHPHPLYGGNMDNNVVIALKMSLASCGWGTLRFNFRGVGSSGGHYGDGRGEVDDLIAVIDYIERNRPCRLHVAGYSYGAWIALRAIGQTQLGAASLCLISPPIDFLDFSSLTLPRIPTLITLGDSDSFCSPAALQNWLASRKNSLSTPTVEFIKGCDHFYWGHETVLRSKVEAFVSSLPAEAASEKIGPPVH